MITYILYAISTVAMQKAGKSNHIRVTLFQYITVKNCIQHINFEKIVIWGPVVILTRTKFV